MAQKTTSTTTTTTKKSSGLGLNKISFYTMSAAAILYLVAAILALVDEKLRAAVGTLQGIAAAIMICIVAVLGWRYVRHKTTVWKVLYFVFLALVILGIVIPLIRV